MRWGSAEPSVRAPIIAPSANPRPTRYQLDIAFSAGGYTPASAAPVTSRAKREGMNASVSTMDAFARAAIEALIMIRRLGGIRSARLVAEENTAPTTNPSWTAMVSQLLSADERSHRSLSCPSTAAVENHGDIASTSATARMMSCRRWSAGLRVTAWEHSSGREDSPPTTVRRLHAPRTSARSDGIEHAGRQTRPH